MYQAVKMNEQLEKIIGGICGFFGGMIMFIKTAWIDPTYWESLLKASITALVCGFMGVAGKYLYSWVVKKYFKSKNKKS